MLARNATAIHTVFRGDGQILDLGQGARTITPALRKTLVIRDRGCSFPGRKQPPAGRDAHHVNEWAKHHGETSTNNPTL